MIVAHSSIYHRPSSSSPIVSGASSSSSSPTNRDPFRVRAARMEKSSPPIVADRDERSRPSPSTSFPAPGVAAIARQAVAVRSAPSSERARRRERAASGRSILPLSSEPPRIANRCDAMRFRSPGIPTAPMPTIPRYHPNFAPPALRRD